MKSIRTGLAALLAFAALPAWSASNDELESQIKALATQVQQLKADAAKHDAADDPTHNRFSWLSIGGDLRVRHDVLRGHAVDYVKFDPVPPTFTPTAADSVGNDSLFTVQSSLSLKARVAEGVLLKTKLAMNKVYGMAEGGAFNGRYFADRFNSGDVFDGTVGKVPGDSSVVVEQAYADWSNIGGQPIWLSAGRRPSTGGVPTNLRKNDDHEGVSGVNGLLVDYVFDGFSFGYAPDIAALPGFATKLCYGRAFSKGFQSNNAVAPLKNTDMLGIVVIPLENDTTRVDVQFQHAFDLMDTIPGPNVSANLGDMEEIAAGAVHTLGALRVFGYGALSRSFPNGKTNPLGGGLLYNAGAGQAPTSKQGWAVYTGLRYDIENTGTKIGAEYNVGSKHWLTFTPAADDVWTSKLGTRGNVYEAYIIQDVNRHAVAPKGKMFFRLGWQYYDFKWTNSNNWVGGTQPVNNLTLPEFFTPLDKAIDVYTTFEVHF